ncbi:transcriptional regulator with XRE-family HTH domain [Rhizobium sp. BK376]|nr:transcriptional regulator with XRE-family HTH domain [Rhizobium sp. BK376]
MSFPQYDPHMSVVSSERLLPFGSMLRRWRQHRRLSQLEFAEAADSSARHLSYLETGRAKPSREMVLRLAECLDVPLRDRNRMLLSAGFAPAFEEHPLHDLTSARLAIEQVINAHRPYPAFAVDRHWDIVLSNRVLPQLYVDVASPLLIPPVNVVRLMLHPDGMASRIVNLGQWRRHIISVLQHQIEARAEPGVRALLDEVISYPYTSLGEERNASEGEYRFATPLQIRTDLGTISFISTTTVFGTPTEVTLSELALEMLFPADAETVERVGLLSKDNPHV